MARVVLSITGTPFMSGDGVAIRSYHEGESLLMRGAGVAGTAA
jgi:hypothetical protein